MARSEPDIQRVDPPDLPPNHDPGVVRRFTRAVAIAVRLMPFTHSLLIALIVLGVATGALAQPVKDSGLLASVGYGVPSLIDGRVWTFFTGWFFGLEPFMYLAISVIVLVGCGLYEIAAGTARAIIVFAVTQLGGTLLSAVGVWVLWKTTSWPWALNTARELDVGFSAGAFGTLAAWTTYLRPRFRNRVRVLLFSYLVLMLGLVSMVWDPEHLLAAVIGVVIGPKLAGHDLGIRPRLPRKLTRRQARSSLALLAAFTGLINLAAVAGLEDVHFFFFDFGSAAKGRLALIVTGLVMLMLAHALYRGRRVAWMVLLVAEIFSVIAYLARPPYKAESIAGITVNLLAIAIAVGGQRAFRAEPDAPRTLGTLRNIGIALVALVIYAVVGYYALARRFEPEPSARRFADELLARLLFQSTGEFEPKATDGRVFLVSVSFGFAAFLVFAIISLLRSAKRPRRESPLDRARALEILHAHGRSSVAYMTTWAGNTYVLDSGREATLGYRVVGGVGLALGDPIGPEDACVRLVHEFKELCFSRGWAPCFYAASSRLLDVYQEIGFAEIQVGEDTVVELQGLEFKGKAWQDVRTAINKAEREGIRLETIDQGTARPAISDQLRVISDVWTEDKALPEMGFTLGSLTNPPDPEIRTSIAIDEEGTIHGFTTWLPAYEGGKVVGWTIDIMRRRPQGFRSVMEFLIAKSAVEMREQNYEFISLATAPLARIDRAGDETKLLEASLAVLADAVEPYYGFKSLFAFKKKFQPRWDPVYLVFPGAMNLPAISYAIMRAYLPELSVGDIAKLLKDMGDQSPTSDT